MTPQLGFFLAGIFLAVFLVSMIVTSWVEEFVLFLFGEEEEDYDYIS